MHEISRANQFGGRGFNLLNKMAGIPKPKYVIVDSCVTSTGNVMPCPSVPQFAPCSCIGGCDALACNCVLQHGCHYDQEGKLKDCYFDSVVASPVIECSKFCSCDKDCMNKTSQKGTIESLYVSDAGPKGSGVYTSKQLKRGTFVCEYVGQLIKVNEYNTRVSKSPVCYSLKLVEHLDQDRMLATCIDASYYGNISRYINHSCSPNLAVVPVRSDSIVPRVCLFTSAPVISEGEELCFSYCDTFNDTVSLGDVQCYCKSENCKGYLPLQV